LFAVKIEQIQRDEEVALIEADEMAPWIIDPLKSRFYKLQTFMLSLALLVELVFVPLVGLDPSILVT